jgi:hypothetical protein
MPVVLAALIFCLFPTTTKAKTYDPHGFTQQSARHDRVGKPRAHRQVQQSRHSQRTHHHRVAVRTQVNGAGRQAQILGGRPAGCPQRYCACALAIKLFGRLRPELHLAANWLRKFPRTSPGPMMVAARSGHVMQLLEHSSGDKWKVWDANSGKGLTRIHIRSIRGFAVVNPHATNVAQAH